MSEMLYSIDYGVTRERAMQYCPRVNIDLKSVAPGLRQKCRACILVVGWMFVDALQLVLRFSWK